MFPYYRKNLKEEIEDTILTYFYPSIIYQKVKENAEKLLRRFYESLKYREGTICRVIEVELHRNKKRKDNIKKNSFYIIIGPKNNYRNIVYDIDQLGNNEWDVDYLVCNLFYILKESGKYFNPEKTFIRIIEVDYSKESDPICFRSCETMFETDEYQKQYVSLWVDDILKKGLFSLKKNLMKGNLQEWTD